MTIEMPARRVTTSDIARRAGVSRATVSHVLNNHRGKFSSETEARVHDALAALNYRPSMGGRALANGKSDIIVVVLPNATFGFRVQDALDEVVAGAAEIGASVLTRFAGPDEESTIDALHYISPLAVWDLGGLGLYERNELEKAGMTVIPSTARLEQRRNADPDTVIGELQLNRLLHTKDRVVYASLKDQRMAGPSAVGRAAAFTAACESQGLGHPVHLSVELTTESGAAAVAEFTKDGPVGVACYNDDVATAIVAGARRLGLGIPEDVAVIGVDVTPLGQMLEPPLTSVEIDISAAIDFNLQELRALFGKPRPEFGRDGDVVHLHPGGTA